MEVCKGKSTPNESDMGVSHTDAIFIVPGTGRNNFTLMEGSEDISVGNAKVRAPETMLNQCNVSSC